MQKTDFVKAVAEKAKMSQKDTKEVIDAALEVIAQQLKAGEKVTLTGFGTFEVRKRQAREGVNPQTKKKIKIPATKTQVSAQAAHSSHKSSNSAFGSRPRVHMHTGSLCVRYELRLRCHCAQKFN